MTKNKLHMIGHAHIDPVWLWRWQEGFHEVKATFQSALERMKEYDDFIFVASSAAFYEWVEKSAPAMFEEIKARIMEGRWQVVGGWWIEPDCNIPNGESFVRQGLYGQRYFKEKFGVVARVGFNVDSFGHSGTLPQILKKSEIPYYTFLRPMPHEKSMPSRLFWWESPDGSRVLAEYLAFVQRDDDGDEYSLYRLAGVSPETFDAAVASLDFTASSEQAKQLIEKCESGIYTLRIVPLVVAEVVFVLSGKHYNFEREEIAGNLILFLQNPDFAGEDRDALILACKLFAQHMIDFADAYLAAVARTHAIGIASFDQDFKKIPGLDRLEI